jgi:hypothetical protein
MEGHIFKVSEDKLLGRTDMFRRRVTNYISKGKVIPVLN